MSKESIAVRTSIALPADLSARLEAQSAQTGATVAELIRRAVAAVTPPSLDTVLTPQEMLDLGVDKVGHILLDGMLFEVQVLDVRQNRFLVEPIAGRGQSWVPAERVMIERTTDRKGLTIQAAHAEPRPIRRGKHS